MTNIPKTWKKTAYQKAEIWGNIELQSLNLYQLGACRQNLSEFNKALAALKTLGKQLERSQIAETLDK